MTALEDAIRLLRGGEPLEAEQVVADAARAVEAEHGSDSPEYASAQFDLAQILVGVGDLGRSAAALKVACAIEGVDEQSKKDRLTYLMNLGEILARGGELQEAERVLLQGVTAREELYGDDHPGFAFGLEPLAEVLLLRGEAEQAKALADRALKILWDARHPRIAEVLALRSVATKAVEGLDAKTLDALGELPDELIDNVVRACLDKASLGDPGLGLACLAELRDELATVRGDDEPWLVTIAAEMTNAARANGDHDARKAAFGWLVEALDQRDDAERALEAVLGLAMAHADTGDRDAAESAYRAAAERATKLGSATALSQVKRNHGLYLSELDDAEPAAVLLGEATQHARDAGDEDMLGRALIAEGIFVQHDGRLQAARDMLREALRILPASHPDTLYARSHLNAIDAGGSCGCGDMSGAMSDALQQMVLPHLPPGLLRTLELTVDDDGKPNLRVDLAREPSPDEMELLDRVLNQAMAQLRTEIESAR